MAPRTSKTTDSVAVAQDLDESAVAMPAAAAARRAEYQVRVEEEQQMKEFLKQNPKLLSLQFLCENRLPVYVRNNLSVQNGQASKLVFSIKVPGGESQPVEILHTHLPQLMTATIDHDTLFRGGKYLKECLQNESLVLVNPLDAEAELSTPYAQKKMATLHRSKFALASGQKVQEPVGLKKAEAADKAPMSASAARMRGYIGRFNEGNISAEDLEMSIMDDAMLFNKSDWGMFLGAVANKSESLEAMAREWLEKARD